MIRMYKDMIKSKIDYGCTIYAPAKEHILDTLNPVHNAAIRLATGALRSLSVNWLYTECGEPLLRLRYELLICTVTQEQNSS